MTVVKKANRKKPITARNACDRLFSEIVRSDGICRACASFDNLQCAHIIRRGYTATRTDLDNAFCLCAGCHMRFHREPDDWMRFVGAEIGLDEYARLKAKALAGVGVKFDWFTERERLKALHKELAA